HPDRLLVFLEELLKARVAAQRVPPREQFQSTIAESAWEADDALQLFKSEISIANPGSDHCQIRYHPDTIHCIFFHRKKLDCAPAFAQRVFSPPETGVNQRKQPQRLAVIGLGLDDFLLFGACSNKRRTCFAFVFPHARDKAFYQWATKKNLASEVD